MKRYVSVAVFACLAVATLAAQAPKGWLVRADRSTSASDPDKSGTIKFVTMGTGFHATNPQAAVYWNPENTASTEGQPRISRGGWTQWWTPRPPFTWKARCWLC